MALWFLSASRDKFPSCFASTGVKNKTHQEKELDSKNRPTFFWLYIKNYVKKYWDMVLPTCLPTYEAKKITHLQEWKFRFQYIVKSVSNCLKMAYNETMLSIGPFLFEIACTRDKFPSCFVSTGVKNKTHQEKELDSKNRPK